MCPTSDDLDRLHRRFSHRLSSALSAANYPIGESDRAARLAAVLGISQDDANGLICGDLPAYPTLLALCTSLGKTPGFFLDEHTEFPVGTCIVKGLVGGEQVVLRLPSHVLTSEDAGRGLTYYKAPDAMGYGVHPGDFLVAYAASPKIEAIVGKLYLFEGAAGYEVRQCTEVAPGRAVFRLDGEDPVPQIVPTQASRKHQHFSMLVATIRCGDALHSLHFDPS